MSGPGKKILLLCRHAPYGNPLSRAALDVALAAAAFDQDLSLLFIDDGVWQLQPGQDAAAINARNLRATLDSLPLYDLEEWHVCGRSLSDRQLAAADLPGKLTVLDDAEIGRFIESHDQVLSF
jgi:tRNA 2-thiouridine synthesizing protein C